MSKCAHESCKHWNKERGSCFFFVEGPGEIKDMPCYEKEEIEKLASEYVSIGERYVNDIRKEEK